MQQEVIIVGGGMVGLSLALMLAKTNITVKLLKPSNTQIMMMKILHRIIPVLMHVIAPCHVVAYKSIRSLDFGMPCKNMLPQFWK